MPKPPLNIAFLWHMHQPVYAPPHSSVALLPWTRLHALKDYIDMPLYCERTGFPATFNLVPCLLEQLIGYSEGTLSDVHLELSLKPIEELTAEDKYTIFSSFFAVSRNLIARFPRYIELYEKYGHLDNSELKSIALLAPDEDILDLTVLFDLAWCGEALREESEIKALVSRGRGFSIYDREALHKKSTEWISNIIPTYKRLWSAGTIELTFSPYYHPILPLLCDTASGKEARPNCPLPETSMRFPQDSARQIETAIEYFKQVFGRAPNGMWPSEGSVSEEMLTVLAHSPIRWIATDETILRKSRPAGNFDDYSLYRPWSVDRQGARIAMIFRDHRLSDNIGFDYSRMSSDTAIEAFINKLRAIWSHLPDDAGTLVSIVLDGENAWEFFPANGKEFLEGLYSRLLSEDWINPVKIDEFLFNNTPKHSLEFLAPGSWIDGDFCTWIGHPEKNRAWDELAKARNAAEEFVGIDKFHQAMSHILIAEGSDWFWWFGRSSGASGLSEFDKLFRARIEAVYHALGLAPPESIFRPIISGAGEEALKRMPTSFICPTIDGRRTNFFEWQGAGIYENTGFWGAMHGESASFDIKKILFGFDENCFYMRIDTGRPAKDIIAEGVEFVLEIASDIKHRITIGKTVYHHIIPDDDSPPMEIHTLEAAVCELVELAIPLEGLVKSSVTSIGWSLRTIRNGETCERYPSAGYLQCEVPSTDFESGNWIV